MFLRKLLLIVFLGFFSFSAFSANVEINHFEKTQDIKNNTFAKNMQSIIKDINEKEYLNENKKRILIQKVIFVYKAILASDSEDAFVKYIAPDFLNFSLCIPYYFKKDGDRQVEYVINSVLDAEGQEEIDRYLKVHNILYSEDFFPVVTEYINDKSGEIQQICNENLSFSNLDDIIKEIN